MWGGGGWVTRVVGTERIMEHSNIRLTVKEQEWSFMDGRYVAPSGTQYVLAGDFYCLSVSTAARL